jgi:ribosomal protein S18 acetylase RimI-like enzyme
MKIRKYKNSDRGRVLEIWKGSFNYSSPHSNFESSLKRKLKQKDGLLFVADTGKTGVAGVVMAGYDGHRGWIYSLAVKRGVREKGIGTSLMKTAEKELKKRGAPKINLQIMPDNRSVVKFYKKLGYKAEPRISMGKKLV